jgi:hypothetical protein
MSYTSATLPGGGTAYFDGALTVPQEVFPSPQVSYPFPADQFTRVIRRRFHVLASAYSPAALDTPDTAYTQAYLVEDVPVGELPGGVWEIQRTFAEIPLPRNDYETYIFPFPGISGSVISAGSAASLLGVAYCATNGLLSWTGGLSVATFDTIYGRAQISYRITPGVLNGANGWTSSRVFSGRTIGTNTINIGPTLLSTDPQSQTIVSAVTASAATFSILLSSRQPIQRVVISRVEEEYFLVGESPAAAFSQADQIQPIQVFAVRQQFGNGQETDFVSNNTLPNLSQYNESVMTREDLVAEESRIDRYLGNIYRRRTRYVKAQ